MCTVRTSRTHCTRRVQWWYAVSTGGHLFGNGKQVMNRTCALHLTHEYYFSFSHRVCLCVVQCVLCALAFFRLFPFFSGPIVIVYKYYKVQIYDGLWIESGFYYSPFFSGFASFLFSFALFNWTAMTLVYSIVIGVLFLFFLSQN